jgi:aerobic carbon-monoxide dehydrogenase medium subunit
MKPAQFSYLRPETLAHAIGALDELPADARVIAGGQSLGPMLNLRLAQPRHVVDISRLDELRRAVIEGDTLAIGACVTHAQIEDGKIPDVTLGLMPHVARGIAYRAVRNRGTIGGSLAHADPAADWLTAMIALDASLRLRGANGERQVKVSEFVTGALETVIGEGQLITHVLVPRLTSSARWGHAKYARKPGDFAESMAVAIVDPERGSSRIVLGRRSELPSLMARTSELLAGKQTEPSVEKLHAAIEADLRSAHVGEADWTMHRAILLRGIRDLQA